MLMFGVILGLIIMATIIIGSYFVRYSLMPNKGAEAREVVSDERIVPEEKVLSNKELVARSVSQEKDLRDAWLNDMDVIKREVSITSHDDLRLSGHVFEQEEPADRWFILLHGYQASEYETFTIAQHLYEGGYNVLTVSLRAHGGSEGKYIGMGYLDKDDLLSWTHRLIELHPDSQIIYHGTSMGGATVLMASGMDLPDQVKAVISDSAFSNSWDIFASEMKQRFDLPSFPILNMAQIMGQVIAGYNIKAGNVLKYVAKSTVPILFIHTETDNFVPVSMAHDLYETKTTGDKELYITENGGHTMAKFVAPFKYYHTIFNFVLKYLD